MTREIRPAASAGSDRPPPYVRPRRGDAAARNRDVIGRDCHGGRATERQETRKARDGRERRPTAAILRAGHPRISWYSRARSRALAVPTGFRYLRDRRAGCRAVPRRAADPPGPRWCSRGRRRRRPYDASPGTNIPAAPSSTPFSTAMQRIVRCTSAPSSPPQRSPRPSLSPSPPRPPPPGRLVSALPATRLA